MSMSKVMGHNLGWADGAEIDVEGVQVEMTDTGRIVISGDFEIVAIVERED